MDQLLVSLTGQKLKIKQKRAEGYHLSSFRPHM